MPIFLKPQFNSVWGATGIKIAPSSAKVSQGWVVEIPPYEYDNWSRNRADQMLAHLNQLGIPMWDSSVEYQANKSYVQGTTSGVIYRCLQTNVNIDPELDLMSNWVMAFEVAGTALMKSQNLADVPNKVLARQNLGILNTADYDLRYLVKANNLADIPNKSSARGNLGLGDSAVRNVGNTPNTVAAGDDPRIVNAVNKSTKVVAGAGLDSGGDLSGDVTLRLGTPSHISATSGNTVSSVTHTHKFDVDSLFPQQAGDNGFVTLPGGIMLQWGSSMLPNLGNEATGLLNFPTPFTNNCFQIICTSDSGRIGGQSIYEGFKLVKVDKATFRYVSSWESRTSAPITWFAIGN